MGYIAKLVRGTSELNLNDETFAVMDGWQPPAARMEPLLAQGTAVQTYGGSSKRGERAQDLEFGLPINITGDTVAEIQGAARRLANFLVSGTPAEPVFLHFRPDNDIAAEPLFGQYGANMRYEIIHANPPQITGSLYRLLQQRSNRPVRYIPTLRCKPFPLGKRQILGSAVGGIVSNDRGLQIAEATTNLFTNPIFGHSTYNNNWIDAGVMDTENTDREYVFVGNKSVRLVDTSVASSGTYTETFNVGNTNTHTLTAYIKRPDGQPVTSTHCSLYYGSIQTTEYLALPNGWYRLTAQVTGVASPTATGIFVAYNYPIYLGAAQFEEKDHPTPLCYGDELGCTWSGTAHDSSSTRTAGRLRWAAPDIYSREQGSIRLVWQAEASSDDYGTDPIIFEDDIQKLQLFWSTALDQFYFTADGVSVQLSEELPHSAGDIFVFHCVWDEANGTSLYVNGVAQSPSPFEPTTNPATYFYLGSDENAANHIGGRFLSFESYLHVFTEAEVAADYANVAAHVNGGDGSGQVLGTIPWLWTKDGDNQVDNCTDSSTNNFAVIGGIPGSVPAITAAKMTKDTGLDGLENILFSLAVVDEYREPSEWLFVDVGGTSASGMCGGEYRQTNVGTSGNSLGSVTPNFDIADIMSGKSFYLAGRIYDAGSGLSIRSSIILSSALTHSIDSEYKPINASTTYYLFLTPLSAFPTKKSILKSGFLQGDYTPGISLWATRSSGTGNARLDYFAILPRPTMMLAVSNQILALDTEFAFEDGFAGIVDGQDFVRPLQVIGDTIELVPGKINILSSLMGDTTWEPKITHTITYDKVEVIPRWSVA